MTASPTLAGATVERAFLDPGNKSRWSQAAQDLAHGFKMGELWLFLGWRDVKKNYARSLLGPFWLTLSMGVMVAALGILYSQIFVMEVRNYLPYLAVGLVLWGLISGSITGSCNVFSTAAASIKQVDLPLSVYVYQFSWTQFIIFSHNFVIYVAVALIFGIWPGIGGLLFFPALALIMVNCVLVAMILGPFCARFRDVPMIVSSFIQVAFFMTPVMWNIEQLPNPPFAVLVNPLFHFIEIARAPLLGHAAPMVSWIVCIGVTVLHFAVAFSFYSRFRARIAYWC